MAGRFRSSLDDVDPSQKAADAARTGLAQLQAGNLRPAEYDLYKALMLNPTDPQIRSYYALTLSLLGRYDDAQTELQTALQQAPENQTVRKVQGMMQSDRQSDTQTPRNAVVGSTAESDASALFVRSAKPALTSAPADSASFEIAQLEEALTVDPQNSRLHRDLSTLYLKAGLFEKAKEHIRAAETLRTHLVPGRGHA